MKKLKYLIMLAVLAGSCQEATPTEAVTEELEKIVEDKSPKEMLTEAYQLFKEGDDAQSIELANKVLAIGKNTKNDTLIGRALTSLCRNAQRELDTARLADLSGQLEDLSASSGDQQWLMYRAHMNAEMWRLIGQYNRAEAFYDQSMQISDAIGSMGIYTIEHFNKSFVSTAKGDYESAGELIKKYYGLRAEQEMPANDAYGLIALAYLLEQKGNYEGAHEVATVTRRLFEEQNLFPEPPDEKPLLAVEKKVTEMLEPTILEKIKLNSKVATVTSLLNKYLN